MADQHAEQRARDALAFDPLPPSRWVSTDAAGIKIKTFYGEALSKFLRNLPDAKWHPDQRCWRLPFRSAEAVKAAMPTLDALAAKSCEAPDRETAKREAAREAEREAAAALAAKRVKRETLAAKAFRPEFLKTVEGEPTFTLTLEAIGDNNAVQYGAFGFKRRNWVARLFGSDGRGGWARVSVEGYKDYTEANRRASRGIMATYLLETGPIYEIASPLSWSTTDRYFGRIEKMKLIRMDQKEVEACLES